MFADFTTPIGQITERPCVPPHDCIETQKRKEACQRNLIRIGGESIAREPKEQSTQRRSPTLQFIPKSEAFEWLVLNEWINPDRHQQRRPNAENAGPIP